MNLLRDAWIPVETAEGRRQIRPTELPACGAVAPATPRADFDAATYEFLIGLYQTLLAPDDEMHWEELRDDPPTEAELRNQWGPFESAFSLDHPDHPYMQERSLAGEPTSPIHDLLIEMPGDETVKNNMDLFVKRRVESAFCASCSALALHTLQSFSPAGGRGTLTSLRGGGPLTTVVLADDLWSSVWSNVLPRERFGAPPVQGPDPSILPWLREGAPPKEKRAVLSAASVHAYHVFWGMPRRILLTGRGSGPCTLCGAEASYAGFAARPHGFDYKGGWVHPLTPTQENKGEISSRKGRTDLGGYRHWVGLVAESAKGSHKPARVVSYYRAERHAKGRDAPVRLRSSGYAMDNAKVQGWFEGTMPTILPGSTDVRAAVDKHAQALIIAAQEAASLLLRAYKEARSDRPKDLKGEFGHVTAPLWTRTESGFYRSIHAVGADPATAPAERVRWMDLLIAQTVGLFEVHTQFGRIGDADAQRVVGAQLRLRRLLPRTLGKALDIQEE